MKDERISSAQKMMTKQPSLVVVAAVNDDEVLACNLATSPMIVEGCIPLVVERGHESAALAYNAGLDMAIAGIVIFAHQDVYLPRGWDRKLLSTIQSLESDSKNWGVLGVIGKDVTGSLVGRVWSTGLGREIKTKFSSPTSIASLDELVIVLRKESQLRFDANLPGYHLYGTDIIQSALKAGFEAYVFDGPVIHNSVPVVQLDGSYMKAYQYMQRKWKAELPIWTTIVPVTKSGWPLLRKRVSQRKKYIFKRLPARQQYARHEAPSRLARDLGYE